MSCIFIGDARRRGGRVLRIGQLRGAASSCRCCSSARTISTRSILRCACASRRPRDPRDGCRDGAARRARRRQRCRSQSIDMVEAGVRAIRAGGGPRFYEFATYRWREHCGPLYDNDHRLPHRSRVPGLEGARADRAARAFAARRRRADGGRHCRDGCRDRTRGRGRRFVSPRASPFPAPEAASRVCLRLEPAGS